MKVNQTCLVLNHIMKHGSIGLKEAGEMGIKNLPARILQLRRMGLLLKLKGGRYRLPYWVAYQKKDRTEFNLEEPELWV